MQMKMEATASDGLDVLSSIKNDLNFFKEQLATIDPSVFGTAMQELEDSDSAEDDQVKTSNKNKNQGKKLKVSKTSPKQETEPEQETAEEPYSKIKEKKKHNNSKMAKQRKQKTDARLLNIITPRQEELQQKLRAKIEAFQGKRLSVDEQKEKKKLKRKESLLKSKLKRKFERQNKNKGNLATQKEIVVNGVVGSPNSKPVKPVYNKEGKLVFSKFDFTEAGGKDRSKSNLSGKDYKRLLEKIEKRKEHVEKVKEKDEEKGKEVETKMAWETAIHRAQGQKVKDDPALVKRAMKKKEKIKKQKSKQWSQREEQTKKRIEAKIEKRTQNIQERKQQKKDKKIKRAKKKGRLVAGF